MNAVFQTRLPADMAAPRPLPGTQPAQGAWPWIDEAYAGQMALREALLTEREEEVLAQPPQTLAPSRELLDLVLGRLSGAPFQQEDGAVLCPDGRRVLIDHDAPLRTLGQLVQSDFCLLHKPDGASQHVLAAAVLCFPARWRLDEKLGKPLTAIHTPVPDYTDSVARRVQRMFDGVRPDRPIWRFNRLWYADPTLYQPKSEHDKRATFLPDQTRPYLRAERQTILRLPQSNWVVFSIHTFVLQGGSAAA